MHYESYFSGTIKNSSPDIDYIHPYTLSCTYYIYLSKKTSKTLVVMS